MGVSVEQFDAWTLEGKVFSDDGEGTPEWRAWVRRQKAKAVFAALREDRL